jgi:hypothetical protein
LIQCGFGSEIRMKNPQHKTMRTSEPPHWRGDVTSISRGVERRRDMRKNAVLRGISALHAGQPLAGLRYSGKGANRTILDCSLTPVGPE